MPYTAGNLPDAVKALPEHARDIWREAFNAAWQEHEDDEETCSRIAWAAVKTQYEKRGNEWVRIDNAEDELETVDIPGVEILAVGKWNGSVTRTYKLETLQNLVKSFKALAGDVGLNYEPPLKLGHDDNQAIIQESGLPSIGWVKALRVKGDKLIADFKGVPKKLADIIKAGGYKKVSSELYFDYKLGGRTWPAVLKAVALLGADVPAVKTIADIRAAYDENEQAEVVIYMKEQAEGLSLDGLMTELDRVIEEAEPAIKAKAGAPAIRTYLREVKAKLRLLLAKTKQADNSDIADSLDAKARMVRDAWWAQMQGGYTGVINEGAGWIRDVFPDKVVVEKAEGYFEIPYAVEGEGIKFDMDAAIAVTIQYVPVTPAEATEESSAGEPADENNEKETHMKEAIAKTLGLPADATEDQVLTAIEALKPQADKLAEAEGLKTRLAEAEGKLRENHITGVVEKLVADGKLLPAQVEAARAALLADEATFTKLMEHQPKIVELGERGSDGGAADPAAELSESDRKVAAVLGVDLKAFAQARETEKGDR
jgi:cation transport regulator